MKKNTSNRRHQHRDSEHISFQVKSGESLFEALDRLGFGVRMECGGKGACGKCRITAHPVNQLPVPTAEEKQHLSSEELESGTRLACQSNLEGPMDVKVSQAFAHSGETIGKGDISTPLHADPMIDRIHLSKADTPEHNTEGTFDLAAWLIKRVKKEKNHPVFVKSSNALAPLTDPTFRTNEMTLVHHRERGVTTVLGGRHPQSYGLALDIGTTTLAAYLCDLASGAVLASCSAVNTQRRVGEDVISRIAYCDSTTNGLDRLQQHIIRDINGLISRCLDKVDATMESIDEMTVVGNPAMEHIFAGIDPHTIGVHPYTPAVNAFPELTAKDLGLALLPATPVWLFPLVSGFIGGDTLAVVLADGTVNTRSTSLLVDIGTNGEIVLGGPNGLWAASCATGPALEGAQISCGMRAMTGAIDAVSLQPDGQLTYHIMGKPGTKPMGLCGSGIIDAIAALRRAGGLEENGHFNPDFPGVVCNEEGLGIAMVLISAERSGTDNDIRITLKDIRQIQLAKAALSVGIDLLMQQAGCKSIARTILTGAFGAQFNWRSAISIGMLPTAVSGSKVEARRNLAGVGAAMGLVNRQHRETINDIRHAIRYIDIGSTVEFADRFAMATRFPPADASSDIL